VEHRQHQTLTPRLQQAVRLLQLSSLDFALEVQQAMGNNPFLEEEVDAPMVDAPEVVGIERNRGEDGEISSSAAANDAPSPETAESSAEAAWEGDAWGSGATAGSGKGNGSGDGDFDMGDMVAADVSLRQHLHSQINVMHVAERDLRIAGTLIEALDDDGYLRLSLEELAPLTGCEREPNLEEMNFALKLVQSLDPAGVGARDARECLLLQVGTITDAREREDARSIITNYIESLATRDINGLARKLGRDAASIESTCERIRRFDPRPGWRFGNSNVQFVTPDVVVRKHKGVWSAMLNPQVIPRVRLNRTYADLFQRHRDSGHSQLAAHLQEARWTIRNVEQRFTTILNVANAIVKRQKQFLEYGALAMKPLGLREISEELGLHESTVSRVTNNKFMATPAGVFELKYFFSRAMPTSSGGTCSATAIRGVIREMIDAEDVTDPLSDAEIARRLSRQGLSVARRTVTKYRQMMKVPSFEMRVKHS
ncbi:MAG: polymerase subunit sigma-54, partial [Rhizobacter sp.]|nr:polymerase subunit sigma-54 [Rhizobacter sp.]